MRVTTANSTSYTIAIRIRAMPRPSGTLGVRTIGGLYECREPLGLRCQKYEIELFRDKCATSQNTDHMGSNHGAQNAVPSIDQSPINSERS